MYHSDSPSNTDHPSWADSIALQVQIQDSKKGINHVSGTLNRKPRRQFWSKTETKPQEIKNPDDDPVVHSNELLHWTVRALTAEQSKYLPEAIKKSQVLAMVDVEVCPCIGLKHTHRWTIPISGDKDQAEEKVYHVCEDNLMDMSDVEPELEYKLLEYWLQSELVLLQRTAMDHNDPETFIVQLLNEMRATRQAARFLIED
jgi:hypothetical protein